MICLTKSKMASSKNKNFEWNIETTKLLINLYEENECLYNNLDPEYKNRDKRLSTMTNIANHISNATGRVCLVADVRKKINGIRSQYLAEKLKIKTCKSGSGGDYNPTVYWFPLLRFLDVSAEADASQSNLDSPLPQDESDTQHSHEEETASCNNEHPPKIKKKKKTSQDGDADDLIKEATATMRQMSQHITNNTPTNNDNHIATFCNFVNSELTSILQASDNTFVNKAKRKIPLCLFDIWDETETENLHERPSTRSTNYSEYSVVSGTASSLVIKRNDLQAYSPQENRNVKLCTEHEIPLRVPENTRKSKEEIVYYINNYDPEEYKCLNKKE